MDKNKGSSGRQNHSQMSSFCTPVPTAAASSRLWCHPHYGPGIRLAVAHGRHFYQHYQNELWSHSVPTLTARKARNVHSRLFCLFVLFCFLSFTVGDWLMIQVISQ